MYSELANFYDEFMVNVDYDKWINYVEKFIGDRKNGIDFACGSGKFTVGLHKKGYNIYGVDISSQMLDVARKYARSSGLNTMFVNSSLDEFVPSKKVDFALAMCDGINYIKDLDSAFENIYECLNDDGVFIFDISSEYKLTSVIANNTFSDSNLDVTYIWNNNLGKKKTHVDMDLTFFIKDGENYRKRVESQRQYIHKNKVVKQKLEDAGFCDVKVFGNMTNKKAQKEAHRVHFVAYKKQEWNE